MIGNSTRNKVASFRVQVCIKKYTYIIVVNNLIMLQYRYYPVTKNKITKTSYLAKYPPDLIDLWYARQMSYTLLWCLRKIGHKIYFDFIKFPAHVHETYRDIVKDLNVRSVSCRKTISKYTKRTADSQPYLIQYTLFESSYSRPIASSNYLYFATS